MNEFIARIRASSIVEPAQVLRDLAERCTEPFERLRLSRAAAAADEQGRELRTLRSQVADLEDEIKVRGERS